MPARQKAQESCRLGPPDAAAAKALAAQTASDSRGRQFLCGAGVAGNHAQSCDLYYQIALECGAL